MLGNLSASAFAYADKFYRIINMEIIKINEKKSDIFRCFCLQTNKKI